MGLSKKTILSPIKSASIRILNQLAVKENNFPRLSPGPIRMTVIRGGGMVTGVDVHDFQQIKVSPLSDSSLYFFQRCVCFVKGKPFIMLTRWSDATHTVLGLRSTMLAVVSDRRVYIFHQLEQK